MNDGDVCRDDTNRPFCQAQPESEAVVIVDDESDEEEIEVTDMGYQCANFAVGRYEIETHAGPTMEFDACEEHAEQWRDDGVVVEEVKQYVDTGTADSEEGER